MWKTALLFKETYKTILRIKSNISKGVEQNEELFICLKSQLLNLNKVIEDQYFSLQIINFLSSLDLSKEFNKIFELFNDYKKEYLKKEIFIVFGRNRTHFRVVKKCIEKSTFSYEFFGNKEKASPIIFETLIEKISSSFKVVVIVSADDHGKLFNSNDELSFRPRQNVVLELGLSYGILNKDNVLLIWDNKISREEISDLQGVYRVIIEENKKWKNELMEYLVQFENEWMTLKIN